MRMIGDGRRWVPVSERLPEKDGAYLTYTRTFLTNRPFIDINYFAIDGSGVDEYGLSGETNVWYFYDLSGVTASTDRVTHWMPLPEPPRGDKG